MPLIAATTLMKFSQDRSTLSYSVVYDRCHSILYVGRLRSVLYDICKCIYSSSSHKSACSGTGLSSFADSTALFKLPIVQASIFSIVSTV
jgi:hypothetical protein